jgi:phenylalanyl-tRNA synthetase beta chain
LEWQPADRTPVGFFDLKGVVEALTAALHLDGVGYEPDRHPALTPGRTARMMVSGQAVGWLGEVHPAVTEKFDLHGAPVLVAELDLAVLVAPVTERHVVTPVPIFPPVKEDLAVVVAEDVPAARVAAVIRTAGGSALAALSLFDVYRGEQIGAGKKSLAFSLTYLAPDRTLTDADAAKLRQRIVRALGDELGATLRA